MKHLHVVGIGASAGGVESLQSLLKDIKPDTGMAYIIVQHLSPDYESVMDQLLAKKTSMAISVVSEEMKLEANHVYLISKNSHIQITEDSVRPVKRSLEGRSTAIDDMLRDLGNHFKQRSIAVILTGTGTDGSIGLQVVKESGGIVIVQDPAEALFDGMPNSAVSTGLADYVLTLNRIATELNRIGNSAKNTLHLTNIDNSITDEADKVPLSKIISFLRINTKVDFSSYRTPTLFRRLEKRLKITNCTSLDEYLGFIQNNAEEAQNLVNDFFIGVSSFYRDEHVWKLVESDLIPRLFSLKKDGETIRIWIAGCSTGQEVYTLGVLLQQYIDKNLPAIDYKIFATDIDPRAIAFASQGNYGTDITTQVSSYVLKHYFTEDNGEYKINKLIREKIIFTEHNLITSPSFIRMDFISCRNALIYLNQNAQQRILTKFKFSLKNGGFLLLGLSENLGNLSSSFKPLAPHTNLFSTTNPEPGGESPLPSADAAKKLEWKRSHIISGSTADKGNFISDYYAALLVREHAPLAIFYNANFDIQYINGDVEHFLQFPKQYVKMNLMHLLSSDQQLIVRQGTQQVKEKRASIFLSRVNFSKSEDEEDQDLVNIRFKEFWNDYQKQSTYLLEITSADANSGEQITTIPRLGSEELNQVRVLQSEVKEKDHHLKYLTEQLESNKEELQASNEELMASNEELQASNEELQSVNEELQTLNSELNQKVDEVTAANSDTNNLFANSDIPTIFLDENLRIRKFTPRTTEVINISDNDLGRPLANYTNRLKRPEVLERDINKVIDTSKPSSREVSTKNGKYYILRISPYKDIYGDTHGVVVLFVDITLKRSQELQIKRSNQRLTLALNASGLGICEADKDHIIVSFNPTFNKIFGFDNKHELVALDDIVSVMLSRSKPKFKRWLSTLNSQEEPKALEIQLENNGNNRYVILNGQRAKSNQSKNSNIILTALDITELTQQTSLAQQYTSLSNISLSELFVVDPATGLFIEANDEALNNLGYTPEELHSISPIHINPPEKVDKLKELLNNLIAGKKNTLQWETQHIRKNGSRYDILLTIGYIKTKTGTVIAASGLDITQRKLAEAKIRSNEERLNFVLRSAEVGLWDWIDTSDPEALYWSPEMYQILGWDITTTKPSYDLFVSRLHPEDAPLLIDKIQSHFDKNTPYDVEMRVVHPTEGYRWYTAKGQAMRDSSGKAYRFAGTLTNINDRKLAENGLKNAIRELEIANQYLDNFVYTAAHDLRQPVSNLRMITEMAKQDEGFKNNVNIDRYDKSVIRLENTLNGLVQILEIQQLKVNESKKLRFENILLHLQSELLPQIQETDIEWFVKFDVQAITYVKPYLESILRNLLTNSIKYKRNDTKLTLKITTEETDIPDFILLTVEDNGIGFDDSKTKNKIFKPFSRFTKVSSGIGVGLYMIKTMVERNGGRIEATAQPNNGAIFKVYLKSY